VSEDIRCDGCGKWECRCVDVERDEDGVPYVNDKVEAEMHRQLDVIDRNRECKCGPSDAFIAACLDTRTPEERERDAKLKFETTSGSFTPVQREALPSKSDIFAVLEIAMARAWRADANIAISIQELDRAVRMFEVWKLLKEK
jgi:hypothetical protein